jgi:hypothetical protein
MAIADVRYGSIAFLVAFALIFLGGALNLFAGLRHGLVFQRTRDVTKANEPVIYGFLLGTSTLMVGAGVIACIMVLLTRSWS